MIFIPNLHHLGASTDVLLFLNLLLCDLIWHYDELGIGRKRLLQHVGRFLEVRCIRIGLYSYLLVLSISWVLRNLNLIAVLMILLVQLH